MSSTLFNVLNLSLPTWSTLPITISLGYEMVIGRVLQVGNARFRTLNRVELIYDGYEVTAPSANLGYSKEDKGGKKIH